MYKNIDLVNIPNTLKRLGDPITVGESNVGLRDTDDYLNYGVRVRLNTYADAYVGKIFHKDAADYVGQMKLSKNNKGVFAASYIGMDTIYTDTFDSDPAWDDSGSISSYSSSGKYITLTNSTSGAYKHYVKDLGYGTILTTAKSVIARAQVILPSRSVSLGAPASFCFGLADSRDSSQSNKIGTVIIHDGTGWKLRMIKNGIIDTDVADTMSGLTDNVSITIDVILVKDTQQLKVVAYGPEGLIGVIESANGYWSGITTNGIGFWTSSILSDTNTLKVLSAEVWVDTVIIKVSRNNAITWQSTPSNPVALENNVDECAADVDNNSNIHVVWTEDLGAYYGVNYAAYNVLTGEWTSTTEVNTGGSPDKINPNIAVDESGGAHICWISDSGSGNDLYYAAIGGGVIADEGIIVVGL